MSLTESALKRLYNHVRVTCLSCEFVFKPLLVFLLDMDVENGMQTSVKYMHASRRKLLRS